MQHLQKIAIITARGGSKRIPRKNIKDFLGKSIMAYSIEVALQSDLSLPMYPTLTEAEQAFVIEKVLEFCK